MADAKGFEGLVEPDVVGIDQGAIGTLARIEQGGVAAQVETALGHPRSVKKFLDDLTSWATVTEEVALGCHFSIPRAGKRITGPSIRFAELVYVAYRNLRIESLIGEAGPRAVTAYGTCFDLERNVAVRVEASRRITDREGRRYNDDMINMTAQAAVSIALRNATLRVVPAALWTHAYEASQEVAAGKGSFADRRDSAFAYLADVGCERGRILAHLERERVEDVTLDDVLLMRVVAREIYDRTIRAEDAFPPPEPRPSGATRTKAASAAQGALDGNGGTKPPTKQADKKPAGKKGDEPEQGSLA